MPAISSDSKRAKDRDISVDFGPVLVWGIQAETETGKEIGHGQNRQQHRFDGDQAVRG